jgi:Galactose oxidase, central domain
MNRRITQQELDDEIRSYLSSAGTAEPRTLGDVLHRLPDRAGASRRFRGFRVSRGLLRFATAVVALILVVSAVGLPLLVSRPGSATPSASEAPAPSASKSVPPQASAPPAQAGIFAPTGSMAVARYGATATLLSDGRVLIAGGSGDSALLASAELYDPGTGTFSPAGSMSVGRSYASATLLANGLVLIAGGETTSPQDVVLEGGATATDNALRNLASAELYDPVTRKFSLTGSMTTERSAQTATLLSDDRVLIVGGMGHTDTPGSAELYDPATGKFSPTGSMTSLRTLPTATLLPDGKVLIAGGAGGWTDGGDFATADLYDPRTGAFSPTGSMSTARSRATATLLRDGRVLIAGGATQVFTAMASAELYRP